VNSKKILKKKSLLPEADDPRGLDYAFSRIMSHDLKPTAIYLTKELFDEIKKEFKKEDFSS
jgi:hypothetical protein